jgi:hypothetical protein
MNRLLRPGGMVGTMTWAVEHWPRANTIWDQELEVAGARVLELPATDNQMCCDSPDKVATLLERAGFVSTNAWIESLEYMWRPADHLEYHVGSSSRLRLQTLSSSARYACMARIRHRLSRAGADDYVHRGDIVMATALKNGEI